MRSIALSYGTVEKPTPAAYFEPAHLLGSRIIRHLWDNWGLDDGAIRNGEVDLYNVNIPMVPGLLEDPGLPICWTRMWRNSYGRLFKHHGNSKVTGPPAGPDALDTHEQGALEDAAAVVPTPGGSLVFKFSPDMGGLINPAMADVPVGSDGWAIAKGWVSVTPLRACFAEPPHEHGSGPLAPEDVEKVLWKVRL